MANVDEYGYITLDENSGVPSSNNPGSNNSPPNNNLYRTGIMASSGMFWFLTIAIAIGIQAAVHGVWGNEIVGEVFGYSYGNGIESWGTNLAIAIGPWGFVVCSFIGTLIYNSFMCDKGKTYGYRWYHYVLSLLMSLACSAAWILIVFIISLAIVLIVGTIIVAMVCGALSGS